MLTHRIILPIVLFILKQTFMAQWNHLQGPKKLRLHSFSYGHGASRDNPEHPDF